MDDAKAFAAFLGAPVGGFIVGLLAWELLKVPDVRTFGTIALAGEHLGPWRDPKSAIAAITGICTLVSWAIIGWLVVTGKDS